MNLLRDKLFRVRTQKGETKLTLPEIMESLGKDEIEAFSGIRPHQADSFHVFLSYLAGAILVRTKQDPEEDPTVLMQEKHFWEQGMRDLACDHHPDDAWTLIVEDYSMPAFMQPPIKTDNFDRSKEIEKYLKQNDEDILFYTPNRLDLVIASKNHNEKKDTIRYDHIDEWIYALITLQTMARYNGNKVYNISRMNGGYSNRSIVELLMSFRPGIRWKDAVSRFLLHRKKLLNDNILSNLYDFENGVILVWLLPWDGKEQISLGTETEKSCLDLFFIEIARSVRLLYHNDHIIGVALPSESPRINAKIAEGNLGDPWLPIVESKKDEDGKKEKDKDKAFSVSSYGFDISNIRKIIFNDGIAKSVLRKPLPSWESEESEKTVWLRMFALTKDFGAGSGGGDIYHEKNIPLPLPKINTFSENPDIENKFAEISKEAIASGAEIKTKVLYGVLMKYLQDKKDSRNNKKLVNRFLNAFDKAWEEDFFEPWLWSLDNDFEKEKALQEWEEILANHALKILYESDAYMPTPTSLKYKTYALAEKTFWAYLIKQFPHLKNMKNKQ